MPRRERRRALERREPGLCVTERVEVVDEPRVRAQRDEWCVQLLESIGLRANTRLLGSDDRWHRQVFEAFTGRERAIEIGMRFGIRRREQRRPRAKCVATRAGERLAILERAEIARHAEEHAATAFEEALCAEQIVELRALPLDARGWCAFVDSCERPVSKRWHGGAILSLSTSIE